MNLDRLRLIWGLGIGGVMLVAVGPYPVMGLVADDEIPHRIHNIVGAIQYLPLWAVPVLMFALGRDRDSAWRLAFTSSVVIAGVGVWSGDLVEALSWMPFVTLLPVWPKAVSWKPERISWSAVAGLVLVAWVAAVNVPDLVDVQRLSLDDSHSVRFHFSGTAAAYVALVAAFAFLAVFHSSKVVRGLVAGSTLVAGGASLLWGDYTSALDARDAWLLVVAAPTALFGGRSSVDRGERSASERDEFIGIYDADSTVVGEVAYWIGARFGVRHCALCDITHGMFAVKSEWRTCERALAEPFTTYHRNDAPGDVLVAAGGRFPIVLRRQSGELSVVMGPEDLEQFDGSPLAFVNALGAVAAK